MDSNSIYNFVYDFTYHNVFNVHSCCGCIKVSFHFKAEVSFTVYIDHILFILFLKMIFIFSIIADLHCFVNFLLHSKVTQLHIHVYILFFYHILMLQPSD